MIRVRRGVPADAGMLAELGARTFRDTFAADNRPEDLAVYLERTYGVPQQSADLTDPTIVVLIAEVDGEPVGYAQLRAGRVPSCVTGPAPVELQRLYVDRGWHGRGVAQRLLAEIEAEAARRGAETVWLGVWEHNERAKAFYRKHGFVDVGAHVFMLGTDAQIDRIMARPLRPSPARTPSREAEAAGGGASGAD